jgi:hypothetical protein
MQPGDVDEEAGRSLLSGWMLLGAGFRLHALAFVAVMLLLAALDWWTAEPYWVHWVLLGWGAGLAAHGYRAWSKRQPGAA